MQYSDKVMDHFMNPRNVGVIEDADGVGRTGNPVCGDLMEMSVKIKDDVIADIKFRTFGCGAAIATSSILTERIKGATIEEALKISEETAKEILAMLPEEKVPCFGLATDALKLAIEEYRCKNEGFHEKGGFHLNDAEDVKV